MVIHNKYSFIHAFRRSLFLTPSALSIQAFRVGGYLMERKVLCTGQADRVERAAVPPWPEPSLKPTEWVRSRQQLQYS